MIKDVLPSFLIVLALGAIGIYFAVRHRYKERIEELKERIDLLKERLTECENAKKEAQQSGPSWLSEIAEHDRLELQSAVHVTDCSVHESLTGENPHVVFDFFVRNGSVYAITIDPSIKGFISLNSRRLTGEITPSRLPHNVPHVYGDPFRIRQELTPQDIREIETLDSARQGQGYYDFGNLHIIVNGESPTTKANPARLRFKRVTRQRINHGFEVI